MAPQTAENITTGNFEHLWGVQNVIRHTYISDRNEGLLSTASRGEKPEQRSILEQFAFFRI
jgi:hypothetical protein